MKQVGIIGWRGMVGSVLLDRMREEKDFEHVTPTFFSTSQVGAAAPDVGAAAAHDATPQHAKVQDANDIAAGTTFAIVATAPVDSVEQFTGTVAGLVSSVGTGSGYVAGNTITYVAKDLYCVNADSYPNNYFDARSQIINTSNVVCADSNWVPNTSPSSVSGYTLAVESGCPSSQYYTLGQNNAAVNLSWRYWAEASGWANS